MPGHSLVRYQVSPALTHAELNSLYAASWPGHRDFDFAPIMARALGWIAAYEDRSLGGFVYLAWDGNQHAFLLEPTVLPRLRRRGIGTELVRRAVELAHDRGCEWVHADWEPSLAPFYRACGFVPTAAGLIRLRTK